ncbi:hypothetical protein [Actinoplanes subglobosus]|uniref:Uncharacterized protein n=1 Tax=Actinoplanes subglobosus TaxID=1547892 RepID=A0ABV8IWU1_9ACTN
MIVLIFYGWLIVVTSMSPLEAAAMMLLTGLAAGVVIDRVVDGTRTTLESAALQQLLDGVTGRP